MLHEYAKALGSISVPVIPSDSAVIVADSRFRKTTEETPTNFNAELSNILKAKYVFYQTLAWNQPLFTHNLSNNLLVFQLTHWSTKHTFTYAVFARPFYTYTSYDGNPPGSVYQLPIGDSYANQMEYGLNHDLRAIYDLASPSLPAPPFDIIANPGLHAYEGRPIYSDTSLIDPPVCTIRFRYCNSRGFAIWIDELDVEFRILNCNYISNGHFIHGFGVYNPLTKKYEVNENISYTNRVYTAESQPLLIPDRFYYVTSEELARQRRSQSTTNCNLDAFPLELAVLSLDVKKSNIYHTNSITTESSSIALPVNKAIASFHIQIRDEHGNIVRVGNRSCDVINNGNVGNDPIWHPLSFLNPFYGGSRGDNNMINYLLFGEYGDTWRQFNTVINYIGGTPTLSIFDLGVPIDKKCPVWFTRPELFASGTLNYLKYDSIVEQHYKHDYDEIDVSFKRDKMLNEDVIHVIASILGIS